MLPQDNDTAEQKLAGGVMMLGTAISDEDRTSSKALSDYARSQAGSAANSTVEGWLSQFGTVRSQINLGDDFTLDNSSLDILLPLYDSPGNMLFTQLGVRRKDDRTTINTGLGMRFFPSDAWMLGVNTFYDRDITGNNSRLGIGGEAWTDYLKLSANGYQRLSSWHQSRDFEDYDERPANGYDLRVNGFLPAYPQLGGKLVWEQYFGDEVALFGKDDRQEDPYAITMGLNYTPVPLLTVGAEQRLGKSGRDEFTMNLELNYQLDKSWEENISPSQVDAMRKLSRSRYDLVERNNDIVLEYRKQQVIRMNIAPSKIQGEGKSTQSIAAQVNSKHGIKNINWDAGSYLAAGGSIRTLDATHFSLTLPDYQVAQLAQSSANSTSAVGKGRLMNTYVLTATAEDVKGNHSSPSQITIEVLPPQASFSGAATISGDNAPDDGVTPVTITWHVIDGSTKQPLQGESVTLTLTLPDGSQSEQKTTTDKNGDAAFEATSAVNGEATATARLSSGDSGTVKIHFIAPQADVNHSSLTASPASIIADGKAISTLTLNANDDQGKPVSGLGDITLQVSGVSNTTVTPAKESGKGIYVATLSGTVAGVATVTPVLNGSAQTALNALVTLTADKNSAQINAGDLVVLQNNAVANGTDTATVKAVIYDAQRNPVSGETVEFSASNGAVIAAPGVTDAKGEIQMPVTSTIAGASVVTASVNGTSQNVTVNFTADGSSAALAAGSLTVLTDNAIANGTAENQVQAHVTDASGNPVPNIAVTFSADNGATVTATVSTDASGNAVTPISSATAGTSQVTATVNGSTQTVDTHFIADKSTASGTLTITADNAVANGTEKNALIVTLADAHGNPVADENITFTASNQATLDVTSGVTDKDGHLATSLSSTIAGYSTVTAKIANDTLTQEVLFRADDSSATLGAGSLTVLTDHATANGIASNRVQAHVTDAAGNSVPGIAVAFSADNGVTVAATITTDADGNAVTMLESTIAGTSHVTATVKGSSQAVDVHFDADRTTAQLQLGAVTVTQDGAVADGSDANSVAALVTDKFKNPVDHIEVTFSTDSGATVTSKAMTNSDGIATAQLTSITAGISQATAMVNGSEQSVPVTFVADSSSASIASGAMSVTANHAVTDGVAENKVRVIVTDANGNLLSGLSVSFTAGNSATVAATATTDANGEATAAVTSKQAGDSLITASLNGSSQSVTVTFDADGNSAHIADGQLIVVSNNAIANGTATNRIEATVTDASGNPVSGQQVSFTADNGASISGKGTTQSDGTLSMTLTSTTAGISKVTATVNGAEQTVNVTFVADGASAQIASGALKVISDNATANGIAADRVQVTVTDANGNPVSNQSVAFSADNGALLPSSATTDDNGIAEIAVTNLKAGISNVTATVNSSSQTVQVQFAPDSGTAKMAALTTETNNAIADGTATASVKALVQDANGNPVANQTVNFTATNNAVITATGTTQADGTVTVTLTSTVAGTSTVTADVNSSSLNTAVVFVANPATARIADGNLTVTTDNAVANGTDANQVQVKVTDENNNPLANQTVTFSADNGATIAATGTTDTQGMLIMPLTSTKAGLSTVTADTNGSTQSVQVTFVADSATAKLVSLVSEKTQIVGNNMDSTVLTAKITDANGNAIKDQTVSWSTTGSTLDVSQSVTDSDGIATATLNPVLLSSKTEGSAKVQSSINGTSLISTVRLINVYTVAGLIYWTQNSFAPATTESAADDNCAATGGRTMNIDEANSFIASGGDFANYTSSSAKSEEYSNIAYGIGGRWSSNTVDMSSVNVGPKVGGASAVYGYVCVK